MALWCICVEQEENLGETLIEPDLAVVVSESQILKESFTKASLFCLSSISNA